MGDHFPVVVQLHPEVVEVVLQLAGEAPPGLGPEVDAAPVDPGHVAPFPEPRRVVAPVEPHTAHGVEGRVTSTPHATQP